MGIKIVNIKDYPLWVQLMIKDYNLDLDKGFDIRVDTPLNRNRNELGIQYTQDVIITIKGRRGTK